MGSEDEYYVYAHLRSEDDENGKAGSPYYIGAGKGKRAFSRRRRLEIPKDPNNIIYLGVNLTREQAFSAERHFIGYYGRIDRGTGCLENLADGGPGNPGRFIRPETRQLLSEIAIFNHSRRAIDVSQLVSRWQRTPYR